MKAGGGAGGGSSTGNFTLRIDVTVAGVTTSSTINNVPKPTNEGDFCAAVNGGDYGSLSATLGGQGTLSINSCSFSGSVGQINATMSLTTPIVFSTSYAVKYTYE